MISGPFYFFPIFSIPDTNIIVGQLLWQRRLFFALYSRFGTVNLSILSCVNPIDENNFRGKSTTYEDFR
jgi:hypothetical protein